jgi:hypothetical protein
MGDYIEGDNYRTSSLIRSCRNWTETPMPPNEPANPDKPASFTDEDRAQVEGLIRVLERSGARFYRRDDGPAARAENERADALTRALAYIDHLEALRAADAMPTATLYERERRAEAIASARAALPTSKEGE